MKRLIYILLLFTVACSHKNTEFSIEGKIKGTSAKYLFIQELRTDNFAPLDSMQIAADGSFNYKGKIENPTFFSIFLNDSNHIELLVMPGDELSIDAKAPLVAPNYDLKGSEASILIHNFGLELTRVSNEILGMEKIYLANRGNPRVSLVIDSLNRSADSLENKFKQWARNTVETNRQSMACFWMLSQKFVDGKPVFDRIADHKLFGMIDSLMQKKYALTSYAKRIHLDVEEIKTYIEKLDKQRLQEEVGVVAPEISLPNPEGVKIPLAALKGRVVLLSFWASWSPESMEYNSKLPELYKKYNKMGFEIYQISLDKNRETWIRAIRNNNLMWIQVNDFKFWDSEAVKVYNITNLPTSFLINKHGVIVARNVAVDNLENAVGELLLAK
jgi:peroxiredoxin